IADADSRDIGDRVVRSGRQTPDGIAEIAQPLSAHDRNIGKTRELDAWFYGSLPSAQQSPATSRRCSGQHGSAVVLRDASAGKGLVGIPPARQQGARCFET